MPGEKLNVCFVPGTPFATCDRFTGEVIDGLSVEYAVSAFSNFSWHPTCVQHSTARGAFDACDVLLGKVGNLEAARYGGGEGFDVGPPYFVSRVSILYAIEFGASTGWGFLEPFTANVWVVVWISVVVSSLAAMMISRGRKMSFIRTAPTAMVGASRLYSETDASYFQHVLSIAMAIYSTIVFSLYSSNLLLFAFFKEGRAKKLSRYTIIAPWTHEWLAKRDFPANEFEHVPVTDGLTGEVKESAIDLLRRGTHALLMERIVLDGICGAEPGLWARGVESLRTTFFPFVRSAVMEMDGMYAALVRASGNFTRSAKYATPCPEPPFGAPTGASFSDTWGLFVLVGGSAVVVVVFKLFCMWSGR